MQEILDLIEEKGGLSVYELMKHLNLRKGQIEQVLKYLSVEESSPVIKIGTKWARTAVKYKMNSEKIFRLTNQRLKEWNEVQGYINTD